MRLREDGIDNLLGSLEVSAPGPQSSDAQKRIGEIGRGGERSVKCGFGLLRFPERKPCLAYRRLECRLSVGAAERALAQLRHQLLGVPVIDERTGQRRQRLLWRIAQ